MKHLLVTLGIVFGFHATARASVKMGALTIDDASGSSIGKVDAKGIITKGSSSAGKIEKDGTVDNAGGGTAGRVDDDGSIHINDGNLTVKVHDGTISNSSNVTQFKIEDDGTIKGSPARRSAASAATSRRSATWPLPC